MALVQDNSTVVASVAKLEVLDNTNLTSENTSMEFTSMDFINDDISKLTDTSFSVINTVSEVLNSKLEGEVEEQVKVIGPKTILITSTDNEGNITTLFEGLSLLTKGELKAQYGNNIFVYYQQLYTTTTGEQTYDEAVADDNNFKKLCYTKEDFVEAFTNSFSDIKYEYITYSHKDLRKQQRANTTSINSTVKNKVEMAQSNFGLFLFTSISQLIDETVPIKDLSDVQISTALKVLQAEDYYINEYELVDGDCQSIKQQHECILFIVGTPAANDSYIKMSNLRWITQSEDGQPVKGLIKNNINLETGVQVYLLRLNVWDKRQSDVFIHCNYSPLKTGK